MITLQSLRTGWLKARIAYHRRQANSYSRHVIVRGRDSYVVWMRTKALKHAMKAHDLERRLLIGSTAKAFPLGTQM